MAKLSVQKAKAEKQLAALKTGLRKLDEDKVRDTPSESSNPRLASPCPRAAVCPLPPCPRAPR
jgi:hypothetical protein